jgi:hypothetical protein
MTAADASGVSLVTLQVPGLNQAEVLHWRE